MEDTDLGVPGQDEVDMGQEWPLHETSDVRSYRQFYQSWCGAVQGAYPMTKTDTTRVSAPIYTYTHTQIAQSMQRPNYLYTPCEPPLNHDNSSTAQLAALLTHIYYGDRSKYKSWPPEDYE